MPRYPYRDLGTKLNRDFRNNLNANFDDIEADLRDIQSDLDAKESRITQIENDSIERDNDLDARIDNIVANAGNSNTEIVDARNDSVNNVTYPTLKDRLDDTSDKIGILNKKFEFTCLKSFSIHYGVTLAYNIDEEKAVIDKAVEVGCNHMILAMDIGQVLATDNVMREVTDEFLNTYVVPLTQYAQSKGVTVAWKMHCHSSDAGNYVNPTDLDAWFANWKNRCDKVATFAVANGVKELGICNELHLLTTKSNSSRWQTIVNSVKSIGIERAFISCTSKEAKDYPNVCFEVFDIVGFNVYPSINLKADASQTTTLDYHKAFYNDAQNTQYTKYMRDIKNYYNKPLWVTEVGMCPTEEALFRTYLFNFSPNATLNEEVQANYYEAIMTELWRNNDLEVVSLWGINEKPYPNPYNGFSFIGRKAENVVKKYWGGETE